MFFELTWYQMRWAGLMLCYYICMIGLGLFVVLCMLNLAYGEFFKTRRQYGVQGDQTIRGDWKREGHIGGGSGVRGCGGR